MTKRQDPDAIRRRKDAEVVARFNSRVHRIDGGCWLWTGRINDCGYGAISVRDKEGLAHRLSYEIHKGPIPAGRFVLHSCDVRACVNPDHLRVGAPADNVADMWNRGRGPFRAGESAGAAAKLTEAQVRAMRAEYERGGISCVELARRYGIGHSQASNITGRRSWRHVE